MNKYFILISLISSFYLKAQYSLDDLIELSKNNNPSLKALESEFNSKYSRVTINSFLEDPLISFENSQKGMKTYGISEKIFFPAKLYYERKSNYSDVLIAKYNKAYEEKELVYSIEETYFDLSYLIKERDILKIKNEHLKGLIEISRQKYILSKITNKELSQLELEAAALEINILDNDYAAKTLLNTLKRLTVSDISMNDLKLDFNIINTKTEYLSENPLILVKKEEINKASYEISNAKLSYIPDLEIKYSVESIKNEENNQKLMFTINLPIFFFTKYISILKKAHFEKEMKEYEKEDMENKLKEETVTLNEGLKTIEKKLNLYEKFIIPKITSTSLNTQKLYSAMKGDFNDMLNTFNQKYEKELEYYFLIKEFNKMKVKLNFIGGIK